MQIGVEFNFLYPPAATSVVVTALISAGASMLVSGSKNGVWIFELPNEADTEHIKEILSADCILGWGSEASVTVYRGTG